MSAEKFQIDAVLFDLDGTLIDTAPDLGGALNAVLKNHNRTPLPMATIRPHVSQGAIALVCLGFGLQPHDSAVQPFFRELIDYYERNLCVDSRLFDSMAELLLEIEDSKKSWGVVTNKPAYLTDPLMAALNLFDRAACVISGDTLPEKKPHPAPMHLASTQLGIAPEKCVFIGDDLRDVQAGRSAGMYTLAATYGYIAPDDQPENWGADGLVANVADIRQWIDSNRTLQVGL